MDAEEIAQMVRDLKINRKAGEEGVTITKEGARRGNERLEKMVVGKIFARRMINREILRINIPKILRTRGGLEIEMIGHNLFAINFMMAADKRRALEEGPWHFFQDLMILKETKPMQSVADVEFNEITMWIQCHNVPMACMETETVRRIGEKVGKVEEIDMGEGGLSLGKVVRIRVTRLLDKPLIRCVPVNQENVEEETLVIIQYEKLPHFCYICGRIGHIQKDCEDGQAKNESLGFDHRLRAGKTYNPRTQMSGRLMLESERGDHGNRVVGERVSEGETSGTRSVRSDGGRTMERVDVDVEVETEPGKDRGGGSEGDRESMDSGGVALVRGLVGGKDNSVEMAIESGGGEGEMHRDKQALVECGFEGEGRLSPGKIMMKGSGKGWKRLAREKAAKGQVRGLEEGAGRGGVKRGAREMEEEILNPHKKMARNYLDMDRAVEPTAEAAEQPRRQQ